MSSELEQVTTAVAAMNQLEAGLAVLRTTYVGVIYDVTTSRGMTDARAARVAIREPRYEVERIRKAAKAPILALGKMLDTEAARITRELALIEEPIDAQITAEEARKEAEKQARLDAEAARVRVIYDRLVEIRSAPQTYASAKSERIRQAIQDVEQIFISGERFGEFVLEAEEARTVTLSSLSGLYRAAVEREMEAERAAAEREELAKLRAEQVERDRVATAERQRVEAEDKAKRDAAAAEQMRINQARQAELDAEDKRIADERRKLADEQEALRISKLPKPASKKATHNPGAESITDAIALHYSVNRSIAARWLREIDWESATA